MSKQESPRPPVNPQTRASLYGLAALYLAYLCYKIAWPFLTHDPYGPTATQFALGIILLGGGAVAVGLLAWKTYKTPLPEEPEEAADPALPEDSGNEDPDKAHDKDAPGGDEENEN